jgi:hypothetical protein
LVHQSTCVIRIATGRITVSRSIDGRYPCPVDYCKSTFDRSDNLWRHFKGQHAEQNNSAPNRNLDDNVQQAMSLGMLIQPPIEQTPELLRDVGLVVLSIVDGIRLVAPLLWPSVGVKPNTWKSLGVGVLRDSRLFRARQQGAKHLALGCFWCRWKGLEA